MEVEGLIVEMLRARAGSELFKADALPHPIGVAGRRVNWRYVAAVGSYHLLALLAFVPWFYSRSGVVLAWAGVFVFGAAGINLCYHRLLSHRSFRCPLWLEHTFAIIAVWCLEDTPARWVATHRQHHHRADESADPHSPMVTLFWSYMGWLFVENTDLARHTCLWPLRARYYSRSFLPVDRALRSVDHILAVAAVFCDRFSGRDITR